MPVYQRMKLNKNILYTLMFMLLVASCTNNSNEDANASEIKEVLDLDSTSKRNKLVALIDNSSTSYFVFRGEAMGFEYELLSRFSEFIGVDLEIKIIENLDSVDYRLNNFDGDIIAANLTVTKERTNYMSFSKPILTSKQVLVQHKGKGRELVKSLSQLIDSTVFVRKQSSFYGRLLNLSEEIGGNLTIKPVPGDVTVEKLIERVNEGEINFTVADEHVAKINKAFFRNIDIKTPISLDQQMAWAVRKDSPVLLDSINSWLDDFKNTLEFRMIYLKYFGNTSLYRSRLKNELFTPKSGTLSPYDEAVKVHAEAISWDWRLITSLIYQESGFDQYSESWTGASGLMQLMPSTAESLGIDSLSDPEENIEAGIKYIAWLDKQFVDKVPDSLERQKFILAAYNVGLGHVFDAIRLAQKHNLDSATWNNNVAEMLKNKSIPDYYQDDVVYYGYCRGSEPFKYVIEVMERFEHYKNITETQDN